VGRRRRGGDPDRGHRGHRGNRAAAGLRGSDVAGRGPAAGRPRTGDRSVGDGRSRSEVPQSRLAAQHARRRRRCSSIRRRRGSPRHGYDRGREAADDAGRRQLHLELERADAAHDPARRQPGRGAGVLGRARDHAGQRGIRLPRGGGAAHAAGATGRSDRGGARARAAGAASASGQDHERGLVPASGRPLALGGLRGARRQDRRDRYGL